MGKFLAHIISSANTYRQDVFAIPFTAGDAGTGSDLNRPYYGDIFTGTSGFAGTVVGFTLTGGAWAHATHTAAGTIYVLQTGVTPYVTGDVLTCTTATSWSVTGGAATKSSTLSKYPVGVAVERSQWESILSSEGVVYDRGTGILKAGIYPLYVIVVGDGTLSGAVGIVCT